MSSKQEHPIQAMGFWMFGFLSVVLAVLKLTVAGYCRGGGRCCHSWRFWATTPRARLTPETMTVTFEEFSPTHDFFDYTMMASEDPTSARTHIERMFEISSRMGFKVNTDIEETLQGIEEEMKTAKRGQYSDRTHK